MRFVLIVSTVLLIFDFGRANCFNVYNRKSESMFDPSKITFYLIENEPNSYTITNCDDYLELLDESATFSPELPFVFVIHGWMNSYLSEFNRLVSHEGFHDQYQLNTFIVDWSVYGNSTTYFPLLNVGQVIGQFVVGLATKYKINYKNVMLVGHSLGAHVSGIAGKAIRNLTGEKIDRIVGLDPAGPDFVIEDLQVRLDKNDAEFVQVIHTAGRTLGYFPELGHADYYPNGGAAQPMCPKSGDDGECSHLKAYQYYAESLNKSSMRKFVATKCIGEIDEITTECVVGTEKSTMGGYELDKKANGTYILSTNNVSPYAKG